MTISVVIPTLGRPSLAATLESCAGADEVIVVIDTARGATFRSLPQDLQTTVARADVYVEGKFAVTGGHAGRVAGIKYATGTHLAFMDDDDTYTDGAFDAMRDAACDRPVIFRMDHYSHGILWRDQEIRFGNVSTQMYLVPNEPDKLGAWTPHEPALPEPGGDYTFGKETADNFAGVVWRDEITSVLRPHVSRKVMA